MKNKPGMEEEDKKEEGKESEVTVECEEPDDDMDDDDGAEDTDDDAETKEPADKPSKPADKNKKPPFMKASEDKPAPDDKKEKDKMKMSELMGMLSGKSPAEQVSLLEGASLTFSDTDDSESVIFNELLNSKRMAVQLEKDKQDALHLKRQAEKARQSAEAAALAAAEQVAAAKQIGYDQKVTIFCDQLRRDKHHESAVKEVENILSSVLPSSRDMKFSTSVDGADATDIDLFNIVKKVMDALPADARLDFSEKSTEEREVSPTGKTEEVKQEKKQEVPTHVSVFHAKYSDYLKEQYGIADANGLMSFSNIVSKIDPETGDYKV